MTPEVDKLFIFCDLYQPTFYIFFSSDSAELCLTTRFTTFSTPFLGFTSSLPSSPTAESACRQPAVQSFAWLCYFVTWLCYHRRCSSSRISQVSQYHMPYIVKQMLWFAFKCFALLYFGLICFASLCFASFFSIVGIFSCFGCEIHKHRGAHCFEVLMTFLF